MEFQKGTVGIHFAGSLKYDSVQQVRGLLRDGRVWKNDKRVENRFLWQFEWENFIKRIHCYNKEQKANISADFQKKLKQKGQSHQKNKLCWLRCRGKGDREKKGSNCVRSCWKQLRDRGHGRGAEPRTVIKHDNSCELAEEDEEGIEPAIVHKQVRMM